MTIINDTDFIIRDAMERWSNSINDLHLMLVTISPEVYQKSSASKTTQVEKVKQLVLLAGGEKKF